MSAQSSPLMCMVIGDPIAQSLGPKMHNAGYRSLAIENQYSYAAQRVTSAELEGFITKVCSQVIRGVSCTIPHKVAVMPYLDNIDSVAQQIGAVNTIVNDNGILTGYNTDWLGIVTPLEKLTSLQGKKVAILGAGGTARAAVYGVATRGAQVSIYNRTLDKAEMLAAAFNATAYSIEDLEALKNIELADIIINTTSVGMHPNGSQTPLCKDYIQKGQTVFDAVYSPHTTRLLREAQQQAARVIHGSEMLLQQAVAQFKLYTEYEAPEADMRTALHAALGLAEGS